MEKGRNFCLFISTINKIVQYNHCSLDNHSGFLDILGNWYHSFFFFNFQYLCLLWFKAAISGWDEGSKELQKYH